MQDFYGIEPPPKETPPTRVHKAVEYIFGEKADALWAWIAKARATKALAPLLVNKEYYDDIDAKMARKWRPTVEDAIKAMRRKGNVAYYDAWPELGEKGRREKFDPNATAHEAMHLAGRIPHTMQGEQIGLTLELGLLYGCVATDSPSTYLKDEIVQRERTALIAATDQFQSYPPGMTIPRDKAVYLAVGMYMRAKIDCFRQKGLREQSYRKQKAFCDAYAKDDHVPLVNGDFDISRGSMQDIRHAPYDLVKLSREEWRAITAVATGLAEPEDTPYPKRLTAIKQVLVHAGLFHDMKPVFEKAAENHEANIRGYNTKVEEKNRNTHGEAPQKLATIRGVDREMHHAARARRGAPASGTRAL